MKNFNFATMLVFVFFSISLNAGLIFRDALTEWRVVFATLLPDLAGEEYFNEMHDIILFNEEWGLQAEEYTLVNIGKESTLNLFELAKIRNLSQPLCAYIDANTVARRIVLRLPPALVFLILKIARNENYQDFLPDLPPNARAKAQELGLSTYIPST